MYFHRHQVNSPQSSNATEVTTKTVFHKTAALPSSIYHSHERKATILRDFSCCVSSLHQSLVHATRMSSTVTTGVVGQYNRYRYVLEFDCTTERSPEEDSSSNTKVSRPYWFHSEILTDPLSNNNPVTLRRINPSIKSLEVHCNEAEEWSVRNNSRVLSSRNLTSEYPNKILKNSLVTLSYEMEVQLAPRKVGTLALPSIQVYLFCDYSCCLFIICLGYLHCGW